VKEKVSGITSAKTVIIPGTKHMLLLSYLPEDLLDPLQAHPALHPRLVAGEEAVQEVAVPAVAGKKSDP